MTAGQQSAVLVTSTIDANSITLKLSPNGKHRVWRRDPSSSTWGLPIGENIVSTFWINDVQPGKQYEFKVENADTGATGYLLSGIKIPAVSSRGKLILIVERTHASALATELAQFSQNLTGDGYAVIRHDVSRTDSQQSVKDIIKAEYNWDPTNVKTVILFGAVPVRRSGNYTYDAHPDHVGAMAADTFYGDMSGDWSGSPSSIPSDLKVAVGRIDLSNLTCFLNKPLNPRSELDLLRSYLERNHAWCHGLSPFQRRAVVADNFRDRPFSFSAWESFTPIVGSAIVEVPSNLIGHLAANDYLMAYACGGGGWTSCVGLGTSQHSSDDFALNSIRCPFMFLLGSYFGDWNNESGLMKSGLASGQCLAVRLAGNPYYFGHRMGGGGTIGESHVLSANNSGQYSPVGESARGVHQALLGDPTLTAFPVRSITGLKGESITNGFRMTWDSHPDEAKGLHGYRVYRSVNGGPFMDLNPNRQISDRGFSDGNYPGSVYMVRAETLIQTPSGSFFALSCGVTITNGQAQTPPPIKPPDPTIRTLEILASVDGPNGPWKVIDTQQIDTAGIPNAIFKIGII